MTKIVYNACFGGFGLSEKAIYRYAELKGIKLYPEDIGCGLKHYWTVPEEERDGILQDDDFYAATQEERIASNKKHSELSIYHRDLERDDPILVRVVEELGEEANGHCANLKIAEIPEGSKYRIDEYDGSESVETPDSYEWKTA